MKKIALLLILTVLSCKEATKQTSANVISEKEPDVTEKEPDQNTLCKINGEPWNFTEASGVVVEDNNKGIRILKLTFTKYLNPGKEHVSLTYDEATKELLEASVQIKQPGKDGKRIHSIYLFNERTTKSSHESSISGQVTMDSETASGTAQMQNIPIQYQASLLADEKDAAITVTELSFNNIPFSDVKKEMEAIFKNSKK